MKSMGRILAGVVAILAMTGVSLAAPAKAPPELPPQAKVGGIQLQAEPVTVQTMLSFEKPGQRTFVLERYDPKTGALIDRVIEPLKSPPELVTAKDFTRRINGRTFKSYGLDVCPVKKINYFGELRDCADGIKEDMSMTAPRTTVYLCRSLASAEQPETAHCYYVLKDRLPTGERQGGAIDSEDGLVMFGYAKIIQNHGSSLRPELEESQALGVERKAGMYGLDLLK